MLLKSYEHIKYERKENQVPSLSSNINGEEIIRKHIRQMGWRGLCDV